MKMALDSLSRAPVAPSQEAAQAKKTATALEAYFLRQMLSEVRKSEGAGLFGSGFTADTYHEMFDEALADAMVKGGGMGLARMLESRLSQQPAVAPKVPPPAPLPGGLSALPITALGAPTSSNFGRRTDPIDGTSKFHAGLDLTSPADTPVRAAGAGVVAHAGRAGSYGNLVVIDHGGGLETRYAHLARIAVGVGDRIGAGAHVGEVGQTGRATGPHLHFEVRRNGKAVDPTQELESAERASVALSASAPAATRGSVRGRYVTEGSEEVSRDSTRVKRALKNSE